LPCVALLPTWPIRIGCQSAGHKTRQTKAAHSSRTRDSGLGKSKVQLLRARQACVHVGGSEKTELTGGESRESRAQTALITGAKKRERMSRRKRYPVLSPGVKKELKNIS